MVGAVALVVLGPERLPKAARIVGTLLGRAQRYVSDVKAEVNRQVDLEALQKMQNEFQSSASDMQQSLQHSANELEKNWNSIGASLDPAHANWHSGGDSNDARSPPPVYVRPNKHWRARRSAVPLWYKKQGRLRSKVLSASARMQRHRT